MDVLHAIEFGQRSEADAPLVLLHALGSDASSFSAVVEYLKYPWVILVNLPGHGGSAPLKDFPTEGAFAGKHTQQRPVEAVFSALLRTLKEFQVEKFHLGGISIGGMLTWYGATQHPEQVLSATVLCAGPVNLPATQWWERAEKVRAEGVGYLADATMQRWFTDVMFDTRRDEIEHVKEVYLRCDPEGYAQCCEILATLDLRESPLAADKVFTLASAQFDPGFGVLDAQEAFALLEKQLMAEDGTAQEPADESKLALKRHLVVIADAAHQAAVEQPVRVAEILDQTIKVAQL
ncbi:MAG: alpha/beta fold hydrolase [Actinomycetaceae bacterium]|nr:alpha/beta fold hydrolase [Actinomycetaceae bacterium]